MPSSLPRKSPSLGYSGLCENEGMAEGPLRGLCGDELGNTPAQGYGLFSLPAFVAEVLISDQIGLREHGGFHLSEMPLPLSPDNDFLEVVIEDKP